MPVVVADKKFLCKLVLQKIDEENLDEKPLIPAAFRRIEKALGVKIPAKYIKAYEG